MVLVLLIQTRQTQLGGHRVARLRLRDLYLASNFEEFQLARHLLRVLTFLVVIFGRGREPGPAWDGI